MEGQGVRKLLDSAREALKKQASEIADLKARLEAKEKLGAAAQKALETIRELREALEKEKAKVTGADEERARKDAEIQRVRTDNERLQRQVRALLLEIQTLKTKQGGDAVLGDGQAATADHAVLVRNKTCNTCMAKKTRCDGMQPCSHCLNRGDQCVYNSYFRGALPEKKSQSKKRRQNSRPGDEDALDENECGKLEGDTSEELAVGGSSSGEEGKEGGTVQGSEPGQARYAHKRNCVEAPESSPS